MNSDLPMSERVLFGVKNGNEDWQEELLCTIPDKFEQVKVLAGEAGFNRFREATIDLSAPPDFAKTIRGVRKRRVSR